MVINQPYKLGSTFFLHGNNAKCRSCAHKPAVLVLAAQKQSGLTNALHPPPRAE